MMAVVACGGIVVVVVMVAVMIVVVAVVSMVVAKIMNQQHLMITWFSHQDLAYLSLDSRNAYECYT